MSDAGVAESFVEDKNKIKIEQTCVNLDCVKKEPKEEAFALDNDSPARQYRIALGESSNQRKFEEDYDNLIGFMDNDVIMENRMIKLEYIKEEDGSFDNFHCNKCKGTYRGYCLKCSTLAHILNNNSESHWNTIPSDILEIRDTSAGKGVFLLRSLPIHIIFGPFEGISGIESTVGHCWKINDNKLVNIKNGNWMKNIACAANATLKNLDIFQVDGNLYFQTNREITEGEELLIYYDDKEVRPLANTAECLYTPEKQEKLSRIFACTLCSLGFGSNKCLMEHKRKCPQMEENRSLKDFELIECHYCKMWMEKWEHEEYHVACCLEKHERRWGDYSATVDRNEPYGDEIEDICGPYERRDNVVFETMDYQCFYGANHENQLNEYTLAKRTNNEHKQSTIEKKYKCSDCSYRAHYNSEFQRHLNQHRRIKQFKCDFCLTKFTQKGSLIKHAEYGSAKDFNCSECSFQTNYKNRLQIHLNRHRCIKQFKCDFCLTKFTSKGSLVKHIKNKHAESGSAKDYKCSECSYQCNHKGNFQRHGNKHRVIKQFKCDICLTKFTEKGSLTKHIKNKHTINGSAKDYKCSECSYGTNYKSNFQMHLNNHRGIKPFKCNSCMAKFTMKGNLARHTKNNHGESGSAKDYKCSECSYQTNYKGDMRKHSTVHTGIKAFQCDICTKKFSRKHHLKTHIKLVHVKH